VTPSSSSLVGGAATALHRRGRWHAWVRMLRAIDTGRHPALPLREYDRGCGHGNDEAGEMSLELSKRGRSRARAWLRATAYDGTSLFAVRESHCGIQSEIFALADIYAGGLASAIAGLAVPRRDAAATVLSAAWKKKRQ
jgi:hypothetical protein